MLLFTCCNNNNYIGVPMIYDYLENLSSYEQIIPWLDVISDFLEDEDLAALPDGKTIISGDDLFVSIQSYETKDAESAEYEAHEKYADLQMILS